MTTRVTLDRAIPEGLRGEVRDKLAHASEALAAASFKPHGDFFGKSFGIAHGPGFAPTACVGFGVERWTYALLAQLGPAPARWPAGARRALGL